MEEKKKKENFFMKHLDDVFVVGTTILLSTVACLIVDNRSLKRTNSALANKIIELDAENRALEKQAYMLSKENYDAFYHLGRTKTIKNGK